MTAQRISVLPCGVSPSTGSGLLRRRPARIQLRFLAVAQPPDVRAMRPEDERRNDLTHDEHDGVAHAVRDGEHRPEAIAAPTSEPSDTYRVDDRRSDEARSATQASAAAPARGTRPAAVATPFPPPFHSRKIGRTWPTIAATPHRMRPRPPRARERRTTPGTAARASRPCAASNAEHGQRRLARRASRRRSSRRGCPSRAVRRSMPFDSRPARYAARNRAEQVRDDERRRRIAIGHAALAAHAGCAAGLPVKPHASRNPLCR